MSVQQPMTRTFALTALQEDDNERRRQAQIADNAAEEERRRRIEEIAEAARQSERERQEAQRRVRLATEQERARQLLQLELHRDMEQKERRRRQNWAVKQLNEQQIRARVQHEHHMRRVQDMLSKNVVVFTKRMELFRSLHRNVCEAVRTSLEDLVNTIWPGAKVMVRTRICGALVFVVGTLRFVWRCYDSCGL
jgi:hypothetical protein